MAISYLCGFELNSVNELYSSAGTAPTIVTGRNSGRAARFSTASATSTATFGIRPAGGTFLTAKLLSVRFFINVASLPNAPIVIYQLKSSTNAIQAGFSVSLNTNGTLTVAIGGATSATTSNAVSAGDGIWHLIEVDIPSVTTPLPGVAIDNGAFARCTGTSVGSFPTVVFADIGILAASTADFSVDDVVIYDSALPLDRPDSYSLTLLKPVADSSIGNWIRNDGTTTTTLYDAVDNAPPTGTAATSTLGLNYVQNSTAGSGVTADNLDLTCQIHGAALATYAEFSVSSGTVTHEQIGQSGILKRAFSFVATRASLSSVDLYLTRVGTPNDNLLFTVETDSSNFPSGTVIASASVSAPTVSTSSSWVPTGLTASGLVVGNRYWVTGTRSGAPDSVNHVDWTVNRFVNDPHANTYNSAGQPDAVSAWMTNAFSIYYRVQLSPSDAVYAVMPVVNDAQQVTTGSPKSGAVLAIPFSPTGADIVTGTTTSGGSNIGGSVNNSAAAQSFVATGVVNTITATYSVTGSPSDFVVEIQTDSGASTPSGVVVGQTSPIPTPTSGSAVQHTTTAPLYAACAPGVKYWVVIRRLGPINTSNYIVLSNSTSADYTGGGRSTLSTTLGWSTEESVDWLVTISSSLPTSLDATFDFGLPQGTAGSTTATAQGAFPTGWGTHTGTVIESPGVSVTDAPTVRVKRTGTYTRVISVDAAGVYALTGPQAVPDAPLNLTAVGDLDSILVDWDAPATGPTPTGYNVYRSNELIAGNDATFDTGVGSGWISGTSFALTWDSTDAAMRATSSALVSGSHQVLAPGGVVIPALPGDRIIVSVDAKLVTSTMNLSLLVRWLDGANATIRTDTPLGTRAITGAYTTFSGESGPAPANAASFTVRLSLTTTGVAAANFDNVSAVRVRPIGTTTTATQYDDATAAADTTYSYYAVGTNVYGGEGLASSTATGTLSTVIPVTLELYDGATLIKTVTGIQLAAEGIQTISFAKSDLIDPTGAGLQLRVVSSAPVDIGAVEWQAEINSVEAVVTVQFAAFGIPL